VPRRSVLRSALGIGIGCISAQYANAERSVVKAGESILEVQWDANAFNLSRPVILHWVGQCARAVSTYLGKFPVLRARVKIVSSNRVRGVIGGTSWGEKEAVCQVTVARHANLEDLDRDWVLTHEMLHFAFPSVPDQHRWMEEGISTYVEPIARAHIGLVTAEQVWTEMVRDMPQGLPEPGDHGLDQTHTWGRTYWGGALYCLLADVGIRKATENRAGLREALQAINAAGGNITVEWPLSRALEIGDRATGATVMSDLYKKMCSSSYAVDLPALWKQLGVTRIGESVTLDRQAPLAKIRASILGQRN